MINLKQEKERLRQTFRELRRAFAKEEKEQYDREITLMLEAEPRLLSGTDIFESNRALGVEAAQYAEIDGPLSVDGETVRYVRMVAAEINGEWKLIVLYLSDTPIY